MIPNVRHLVGEGGQSGRPCWRTNRPLIIPRPNDTEAANTRGRNFVSSKQGGGALPGNTQAGPLKTLLDPADRLYIAFVSSSLKWA